MKELKRDNNKMEDKIIEKNQKLLILKWYQCAKKLGLNIRN